MNYQAVDEGDIIIVMSDGVHDNLDPQTLGLSPRDFDIDNDRWEASPEVFSPFPSSFPPPFPFFIIILIILKMIMVIVIMIT